jgi:hypothetical protein
MRNEISTKPFTIREVINYENPDGDTYPVIFQANCYVCSQYIPDKAKIIFIVNEDYYAYVCSEECSNMWIFQNI